MLKVLKRASNTFIFLYFCLNQDNLYVNSLISIIISLIYESGTYGLKWLKIVQMYGKKGCRALWPLHRNPEWGVITPHGNYEVPSFEFTSIYR